jgi:calcineurin-like phosphoesterase family protein
MTIWLTSDSHFGHHNIYRFTYIDKFGVERRVRERFNDAFEGDAYMVQRWCELIKPEDHIYHLGDVTMERSSNAKEWFVNKIRSLPGHKRLILGNHDHLTMDVYRDAGFQKIKGSHKMDALLLSHYPLHPSTVPKWALANVHGHIHQNPSPEGPYINMSVEVTDYEPVPLEVVLDRAKKFKVTE